MRACPRQNVVGVFEIDKQNVHQIRHQAGATDPRYSRGRDHFLLHQDRLSTGDFRAETISKEEETSREQRASGKQAQV